ncbi:hypothetical protein [Halomonas denitrificans]|nr:hypothetical protein [Halomonas denitrificans]
MCEVRPQVRTVAAALFATVMLVAFGPLSAEQEQEAEPEVEIRTHSRPGLEVVYASPVTEAMARRVADRVELARERTLAFLRQSGEYPDDRADVPIRVLLDPDATAPSQMRSTIFIPQDRVLAFFDEDIEGTVSLAITHEVVHVLAVSAYRRTRGRFFDDGLAVFLQSELDELPAYPNFHRGLHLQTAKAAAERGGLLPLEDTDSTRRNPPTREDLRLAYLQEGSFTQYLIERFGLDAYLRIYYGESPEDVVGSSLLELDGEWRALIGALQVTGSPDAAA